MRDASRRGEKNAVARALPAGSSAPRSPRPVAVLTQVPKEGDGGDAADVGDGVEQGVETGHAPFDAGRRQLDGCPGDVRGTQRAGDHHQQGGKGRRDEAARARAAQEAQRALGQDRPDERQRELHAAVQKAQGTRIDHVGWALSIPPPTNESQIQCQGLEVLFSGALHGRCHPELAPRCNPEAALGQPSRLSAGPGSEESRVSWDERATPHGVGIACAPSPLGGDDDDPSRTDDCWPSADRAPGARSRNRN